MADIDIGYWEDGPGGGTSLSAENLNDRDQAWKDYIDGLQGTPTPIASSSRDALFNETRRVVRDRIGNPGGLLAAYKSAGSPAFVYRMGAADVGTSTALDDGGAAANGTYTGTVSKGLPTPIDEGAALGVGFAGSSAAYITTPTLASIGTTCTMISWVRIRGNNANIILMNHQGGSGSNLQMTLLASGSGFLVRLYSSSPTSTQFAVSSTTLTDRFQWHMIAATINGTTNTAKIYVDGVDVTSGTPSTVTLNSHTTWRVGMADETCVTSHAALFPTVLTAAQIAGLYSAARLDYRKSPFRLGVHSDLTYVGSSDPSFPAKLSADLALGSRVARVSIPWYFIEPVESSFDWSQIDSAVDALVAQGQSVIGVLLSSPTWFNGQSGTNHQWKVPGSLSMADFSTGFAGFATAAVARYKDRIIHWEIWNEQNETAFWLPTPSASDYKTLYDATRAAILAEDPGARVAVGGLTGLSASGSIAGVTFLQSLCTAGAVIDNLSIHPYCGVPTTHTNAQNNWNDILRIADILWQNGYSATDIWITEFGWATGTYSQANQATYLGDALTKLRDYMSRFVSLCCYFIDVDGGPYTHGLYESDGDPKTAAATFRQYAERTP